MAESEWYQIRLYSRGQIEIFQNVYHHVMHIEHGETKAIEISHSSVKNQGSSTRSMRPMEKVYSVEIIEEPIFYHSIVVPGAKWIINGGLKPILTEADQIAAGTTFTPKASDEMDNLVR